MAARAMLGVTIDSSRQIGVAIPHCSCALVAHGSFVERLLIIIKLKASS